MNKYLDHLDKWESAFEQRSIARTKIAKGALLFFAEQAGAFSCTVRDITNRGAGVRLEGLSVLPLEFDLSSTTSARSGNARWSGAKVTSSASDLVHISLARLAKEGMAMADPGAAAHTPAE